MKNFSICLFDILGVGESGWNHVVSFHGAPKSPDLLCLHLERIQPRVKWSRATIGLQFGGMSHASVAKQANLVLRLTKFAFLSDH